MPYSVEIISKEEQSTSTWSGGTTTQLAIYRKDSEYKAQNFKWRLSSACVDIEESTFTRLPGIWRHIMIIDGEMSLEHEGNHIALLKPYDQDSFSGDWTTKSIGCARDFNLMLSQGCIGELEAIFVCKDLSIETAANSQDTSLMNLVNAFYCAAGDVIITLNNNQSYNLCQGDLILIYALKSDKCANIGLKCTSHVDAAVIRANISYM
ncbi:MAG: HutD family protein [Clostridia bacterium]